MSVRTLEQCRPLFGRYFLSKILPLLHDTVIARYSPRYLQYYSLSDRNSSPNSISGNPREFGTALWFKLFDIGQRYRPNEPSKNEPSPMKIPRAHFRRPSQVRRKLSQGTAYFAFATRCKRPPNLLASSIIDPFQQVLSWPLEGRIGICYPFGHAAKGQKGARISIDGEKACQFDIVFRGGRCWYELESAFSGNEALQAASRATGEPIDLFLIYSTRRYSNRETTARRRGPRR